jgi:hypothetical protein
MSKSSQRRTRSASSWIRLSTHCSTSSGSANVLRANAEELNKVQDQTKDLFDRVNKINKQLSKASSVPLKKEMMEGKADPKVIATG